MKTVKTLSLTVAFCLFASLSFAATAKIMVELKDAQGKSVGTAGLSSKGASSGVSMKLNLHGLPPGQHGQGLQEGS